MSTSPPSEPQGPKAPTPYWSTAYVVVVAVLYLWGYWSPFNINVLEYLSLADVVKAAAYPLASVFFLRLLVRCWGKRCSLKASCHRAAVQLQRLECG